VVPDDTLESEGGTVSDATPEPDEAAPAEEPEPEEPEPEESAALEESMTAEEEPAPTEEEPEPGEAAPPEEPAPAEETPKAEEVVVDDTQETTAETPYDFQDEPEAAEEPGAPDDEAKPATQTDQAETPTLSAGRMDNFPEWSPLKPIPVVPQRDSAPDRPSEPAVPPPPAGLGKKDGPAPIEPTHEPKPSLGAFLGTRSAWSPDMDSQGGGAQPGWLGYSGGAKKQASDSKAETGASTGASPGTTGFLTSGKAGRSLASSSSRSIEGEIADAWRSSPPSNKPVEEEPPPKRQRRRRSTGAWVAPVVALLILGGIAFLVWKFVFGPATFTDPEYGYSFSHPGRWGQVVEEPLPSQFDYLTKVAHMPDLVVFGTGLDSDGLDSAAMVAVAASEASPSMDGYIIANQIQRDLYLASSSLSVIDPARATTIEGLSAWRTTLAVETGSNTITVSYYVVLNGSNAYVLIAAGADDAWTHNGEAFDRFFHSFRPG